MLETDLDAIFDRLKTSLEHYAPPLVVRPGGISGKREYHLWSEKAIEIEGRKRKDVSFASLIVQKGYVGLYFMPVYVRAEQRELFAPELLALLKGKSCFHVRQLDDDLVGHVESALAAGFQLYRERGWVDE